MDLYKFFGSSAMLALTMSSLNLVGADNLSPRLVPLPRSPKLQPPRDPVNPQGDTQLVQENVNAAIDGNHEIDPAPPPKSMPSLHRSRPQCRHSLYELPPPAAIIRMRHPINSSERNGAMCAIVNREKLHEQARAGRKTMSARGQKQPASRDWPNFAAHQFKATEPLSFDEFHEELGV
jgi:hypothetical protein